MRKSPCSLSATAIAHRRKLAAFRWTLGITILATAIGADARTLDMASFLRGGAPTGLVRVGTDLYIVGGVSSPDFLAYYPRLGGYSGGRDSFVLRLANEGRTLSFARIFGGTSDDTAASVSVSGGEIVVVGTTRSLDFPVTSGIPERSGASDGFVIRLRTQDGAIISSSYVGGSGDERLLAVAHDLQDNVIVGGQTTSPEFSLGTVRDLESDDALIVWLDQKNAPTRVKTIGGGGFDVLTSIVTSANGEIFLAGQTGSPDFPLREPVQAQHRGGGLDGYVMRMEPSGNILFSTFLGGVGDDRVSSITVDEASGAYHLIGLTTSPEVAGKALYLGGPSDGFVATFDAANDLQDFRFIGGHGRDSTNQAIVDLDGLLHVVGSTESSNFPTVNPIAATPLGQSDGFIWSLDRSGEVIFASFFGGSKADGFGAVVARDGGGLVAVGASMSSDLPIRATLDPPPGDTDSGIFLLGIAPVAANECAFIVNELGEVLVMDVTRRIITGSISVGTARETIPDLTLSADGTRLFVLNAGVLPVLQGDGNTSVLSGALPERIDKMVAIDTSSFTVDKEVPLPGLTPSGGLMAIGPDKALYAANVDRVVQIMDPTSLEPVDTIDVWPVRALAIASGSSVAYMALNSAPPAIVATDLQSFQEIGSVAFPHGKFLGRLRLSKTEDRIYVLGTNSAELFVLGADPLALLDTVEVGVAPQDIILADQSRRAYIGHGGLFGVVSVIDLSRGETIERIQVGAPVNRLALSQDEELLVVATEGGEVLVIETGKNRIVDSISTRMRAAGSVAMALGVVPTGCEFPAAPPCPGDCNEDGQVAISELISAVSIALRTSALETCPAADTDQDTAVAIGELIQATRSALEGC